MGKFDPRKNKRFLSKLSIDQRDQIMITLILLKKMIDADGVENQEEKEYLKNYLINCGITSQDELESILDSASSLTEDQYDTVVGDFNQDQKLTILHELIGVICSDNEIDENELVLLFEISRDMNVEDEIIIDMLAPKKDLIEKSFEEKDEVTKKESNSKKHKEKNFTDKNEFFEAVKSVDTDYLIDLQKMALKMSNSDNGNIETEIKIYTQIINEIPLLNNKSGGVVYASKDLIEINSDEGKVQLNNVILEETYFNRAQAYSKLKSYEKAEMDYQKAIDVNPGRNDATFYHYLGCTKFQLKRPIDDIIHCFDNSIRYNENDNAFALKLSDSYYMRAGARLSNENITDAKEDIEKAFELDPEDKAIQRLKDEIDEILKNNSNKDTSSINSDLKIKKTDKFCSKCGEHFNGSERFCTSCGNKRNIVKIKSTEKERVQKKIKKLKIEEELKKLKSHLESITVNERGKIYDLNYWFDQVVTRVESHETYYSSYNIKDLKSLKEIAHSHYKEYHHRMIEENDENKLKFVVPRVECFLKIFNKIDYIKNEDLIEEDMELYDRYYFHSKSSLYGAVKFLNNDISNGLEELQKIYPEFDEEILNFQGNELSDEMISKSKEMLSPTIRIYLNKVVVQNAERFIDHKNSSAYDGLVKMIDSSLPIDSKKKNDEKKAIQEIKNLSVDEKEYLNRIITAIIFYAKLQNWNLFISKTINELSKIDVSIDEEIELEETESPLIDEWEKVELENEGDYMLIKRNNQGIITHKKVYSKGKLERFDLSKEKEELKKEEKRLLALLYYYFGEINPEKVSPFLKNLSEKEFKSLIDLIFWKIYNSYDDINNLPALILNDYANFLYDNNLFSEGIHFSTLAFNIEEKSSHADTVGEGYYKQEYFDMAFSSFSKAVEIDKKNNSHREDHIINYIKAALKTENLKSAQNGIDLLKENFTENKEIENFEKELNSLISNTEEFKCPECGHIPKISQKFCTKCGTKFKEEDLQEDNYYENITTYLKAKNETLFFFVKEHIDISKKGETYPEEVLIKSIEKFIDKLKTDKELFRDVFDNKGNKKNNDENLNNMMFLTLYPKFFMSDDIETLAKVLNETESDKFDGYDDIEQYYSYYVYIRDFMINESKKYMK